MDNRARHPLCFPSGKAFAVEDKQYKQPLKADIPKELHDWYNRKNLYLVSNHQIEENRVVKKLLRDLQHDFAMIAPFYHYLCAVAV
jgi:hypothetical protein